MKTKAATLIRIGYCGALALPAYFLGTQGLVGLAFAAYLVAVLVYWFIQYVTDFRHPLNGALALALIFCGLALFLPALARTWHIHPL